jgi:hypothetical protein
MHITYLIRYILSQLPTLPLCRSLQLTACIEPVRDESLDDAMCIDNIDVAANECTGPTPDPQPLQT